MTTPKDHDQKYELPELNTAGHDKLHGDLRGQFSEGLMEVVEEVRAGHLEGVARAMVAKPGAPGNK